jgi:predicted TIM-barrel fold metal-dependent hydrolase
VISGQRIIDAHMHYYGTFLPKSQTLLDYMDENGIDGAVVNTLNTTANMGKFNPETALEIMEHRSDPEFDIFSEFHAAGQPDHRELDHLVQKAPERIFPFFWYNPINPADADQQKGLSMVQQAIDRGYKGVKLQLAMTSCSIERLDPIANLCETLDVPIYIHPSAGVFGAKKTNPFDLVNLAQRHPKLNMILGHAGYSMEFVIEAALACMGAGNIYFETSLSVPFGIITYIKLFGARRVIFGTDSPSAGPFRIEYEKIAALNISEKEKAAILHRNIAKLLHRHD